MLEQPDSMIDVTEACAEAVPAKFPVPYAGSEQTAWSPPLVRL